LNFALPDLRGRTPIHVGSGHVLGEKGGEPAHTVSVAELPTHVHVLNASNVTGNTTNPRPQNSTGALLAQEPGNPYSANVASLTALNAGSVTNTGGSQAHLNLQPFLTLSFCIALQGIFPSPN
jgi:microcystin-dependent protein